MLSLREKIILWSLAIYMLVQALLPFRYLLHPGNPSWHELSHKFIWHMKLDHKKGYAQFTVYSPTLEQSLVINHRRFLTEWQYETMIGKPLLLLQFARYLTKLYHQQGINDIEIRLEAKVALNGRALQNLVDPNINLANQAKDWDYSSWIVPLERS